jgi:hypothetical protein
MNNDTNSSCGCSRDTNAIFVRKFEPRDDTDGFKRWRFTRVKEDKKRSSQDQP